MSDKPGGRPTIYDGQIRDLRVRKDVEDTVRIAANEADPATGKPKGISGVLREALDCWMNLRNAKK